MNSCALAAFAAWMISSRLAIGYVVAYASGEQDRVLNDESNVLSQVGQFQHVDGIAVNPDGSRIRLVEAQQQVDYGRFSGTTGTDYCYRLTGVDCQAEVVKDGLVALVLERDSIEFYPSQYLRWGKCSRHIENLRLRLCNLKDSISRRGGFLELEV